jgi:hypothetical protein
LVLNTKDHKTGQHPLKNRPGGKKTPKLEKRGSGATSAEIAMHQAYSSAFSHDQDPSETLAVHCANGFQPLAEIPFVVEAWSRETAGETALTVCVNRTPITGEIEAARDKRAIDAYGCGPWFGI